MQLSSGKKNAPAAVEEERRPRAEAGSGGEMPAMPGAAHAADAATPFAAMLDERAARATDLAAWKGEKSPGCGARSDGMGSGSRAVPCRNRRWKFLKAEFRKN